MRIGNYKVASLYFIVISCLDVPRSAIDLFSIPVRYYFGGNPPWLFPFCFIILLINIQYRYSSDKSHVLSIGVEDIYFIFLLLIWTLLSIYHDALIGDKIFDIWMNFYLITTGIWFCFYYFLLKTYDYLCPIKEDLIIITIRTVTIVSLVYIVTYIFNNYGIGYFSKINVHHHNGLSLYALLGIYLILFYKTNKTSFERFSSYLILLPLNFLTIMLNQTRGVMLVLLLLVFFKVVFSRSVIRRVVALCAIFLTVIFISTYTDVNLYAKQVKPLLFGLEYDDNVLGRMELSHNYPDKMISAYVRNKTNILVIKSFLEHPIIGI